MNAELITHLSLLKISGHDAENFLQGQLTSDVGALTNSWQYAGYCNPKGRLLALLQIWRKDEDFYALIPNDLTEATSKRLRMYVMRSKVLIETLEDRELFGILKNDASVESYFQTDISQRQHGDLIQSGNSFALVINDRVLIVEAEGSTPDLVQKQHPIESKWLNADIHEGLPLVNNATVEQFIPQMLNLDILGGISFKKGCYTGQEIVARMHYLGKLKQRMFVCDFAADTALIDEPSDNAQPEAGDKIYSDRSFDKAIGTLVSIDHENGKALAVLRLDSLSGGLHIKPHHQLLMHEPQPYEIPA